MSNNIITEDPSNVNAMYYHRKTQGNSFIRVNTSSTKKFVDHLLVFLLKYGNKFSSLDEFGWYLALPNNKQLVTRRISYMELAKEILGKEK